MALHTMHYCFNEQDKHYQRKQHQETEKRERQAQIDAKIWKSVALMPQPRSHSVVPRSALGDIMKDRQQITDERTLSLYDLVYDGIYNALKNKEKQFMIDGRVFDLSPNDEYEIDFFLKSRQKMNNVSTKYHPAMGYVGNISEYPKGVLIIKWHN